MRTSPTACLGTGGHSCRRVTQRAALVALASEPAEPGQGLRPTGGFRAGPSKRGRSIVECQGHRLTTCRASSLVRRLPRATSGLLTCRERTSRQPISAKGGVCLRHHAQACRPPLCVGVRLLRPRLTAVFGCGPHRLCRPPPFAWLRAGSTHQQRARVGAVSLGTSHKCSVPCSALPTPGNRWSPLLPNPRSAALFAALLLFTSL